MRDAMVLSRPWKTIGELDCGKREATAKMVTEPFTIFAQCSRPDAKPFSFMPILIEIEKFWVPDGLVWTGLVCGRLKPRWGLMPE
jgi:hypothetical protein